MRVATVPGRVMSCPASLIAAASTAPSSTICASEEPNARARRSAPAATATWRRRSMFSTATRCMFTPIATEASPRASRLEATTRSCAESTPRPPKTSGIGAAKYPTARRASMASYG